MIVSVYPKDVYEKQKKMSWKTRREETVSVLQTPAHGNVQQ